MSIFMTIFKDIVLGWSLHFKKKIVTPLLRYGILWNFDMKLANVLSTTVLYIDYLIILTISCQKYRSVKALATLKVQLLKIIQKPKFEASEKSVFFVPFILYWKIQLLDQCLLISGRKNIIFQFQFQFAWIFFGFFRLPQNVGRVDIFHWH